MSSGGKNPFVLRGPKKVFIHRLKRTESSSQSVSSESLSDSPLTSSSSPGSFTQSLSPISLIEKESLRMPISESISDNSPDVGADSLTSPSMVQKLDFAAAHGPKSGPSMRYGLDDHWSSIFQQQDQSKLTRVTPRIGSAPEELVLSGSSHEDIFAALDSDKNPLSSSSTFDGALLPSPSELCSAPDTGSSNCGMSPFSFDSAFDVPFQPLRSRRHSLSPKREFQALRSEHRHVSPELPSTTTSPGSKTRREQSPEKVMYDYVSAGPGTITKQRQTSAEIRLCQVCDDVAAGFHCGAYVCEACKKFFVRCLKQEAGKNFVCSRNTSCAITKETRTQCQFCRFQKCVTLGMYKPGTWPGGDLNAEISNIPCKVCGAPSSGYHFGAITCEGCKGFFRRTVKERDGIKYSCNTSGNCTINTATRNTCKHCRYQKCLQVGMTPSGSRIGRQPNAVKHKTMLELQQLHSEGGLLPGKELVVKKEPLWSEEESQIAKGTSPGQHSQMALGSKSAWSTSHSPRQKSPKSRELYSSESLRSDVRRPSGDLRDSSNIASERDSYQQQQADWSDMRPHQHSYYYGDMQREVRSVEALARRSLHSGVSAESSRGPMPLPPTSVAFSRKISHDESQDLNYSRKERSSTMSQESSALSFDRRRHSFHQLNHPGPAGLSSPHIVGLPPNPVSNFPSAMHFPTNRQAHESAFAMPPVSATSQTRPSELLPKSNQMSSGTSTHNLPLAQTGLAQTAGTIDPPVAQSDKKSDPQNTRHSPEGHPQDCKKTKKVSSEELIDQILEASKELQPIVTPAKHRSGYVQPAMTKPEVWNTMMIQFAHSAHATVKFAKKVPGFREIPMQQQIAKVQSAMYQIVLVMLSTKFNLETDDYVYFCFSHEEEALIIQNFPQFKPLPGHFITMGKSLAILNPDAVELSILCALCLFMGDAVASTDDQERPGNATGVYLLEILEEYCEGKFNSDSSRYGRLLSQLTLLQKANSEHLNCVIQVKISMPDLEIPELFEETFLSI